MPDAPTGHSGLRHLPHVPFRHRAPTLWDALTTMAKEAEETNAENNRRIGRQSGAHRRPQHLAQQLFAGAASTSLHQLRLHRPPPVDKSASGLLPCSVG